MFKASLSILIFVFSYAAINAARIIPGNGTGDQTTFGFGISSFTVSAKTGDIFVAAQSQDAGQQKINEFAVSRLSVQDIMFRGITPQKTIINITQNDQPNPLYDRGITKLVVIHPEQQDLPAVLVDDKPTQIYLFENTNSVNGSLLVSEPIADAQGAVTQKLFGLAGNDQGYLFTLTQPHEGQVSDLGTGLAVVVRGFVGEEKSKMRVFRQIPATIQGGSLPFDITTPAISLTNDPVSSFSDAVILHWDSVLQRLFIGLTVTSGSNGSAGARAIVTGRVVNGLLQLVPIAPADIFTQDTNDLLIGVRGPGDTATIFDMTTLHTTTNLIYLVALAGQEDNKQLRVFPLVNSLDEARTGTLASGNATPEKVAVTTTNGIPIVISTLLPQPALQPSDIIMPTQAAAQIGGGAILPGNITSFFTQADTIFVSITDAPNQALNGVYRSQALFDPLGRIASWTRWERAYAAATSIFFGAARLQGALYIGATGQNNSSVNTITQTEWQEGEKTSLAPLDALITSIVDVTEKNITSAFELVPATSGLANSSILAIGLHNRALLAQVTEVVDDFTVLTPSADFSSVQQFKEGVIDAPVNTTVLDLSGGVLDDVGFVTGIAIASNTSTNNAWLVVSGTSGMAVLAAQNGSGWSTADGLASHFTNITQGSFKLFRTNQPVRKMITDDNFIYLLTDTQLLRINLAQSNIAQGDFNVTVIASIDMLQGQPIYGFITLAVSGARALLGTTQGLYQNTPGTNVQTMENTPQIWQPIVLPESSTSVQQLIPISTTGVMSDFARFSGGMVYALTADSGADEARLHRLVVQSPELGNGIFVIEDRRILTVPSQFIEYAYFIRSFATEGALFGTTLDQAGKQSAQANFLISEPLGANPLVGILQRAVTNNLIITDHISVFLPLATRGSWLLVGTDRLYLNE